MVYLFYLFFSFFYLRAIRFYKVGWARLLLVSLPVVLLWILIIGGQYNVGTDYSSYIMHFNTKSEDLFYEKKEYLFGYLIYISHELGIYGQGIVLLISAIWIILLLIISKYFLNSNLRYLYIFLFVFIVFPATFNNQMNGIRQYVAVYFFTLAVCLAMTRKLVASVPYFVSSALFHHSSLVGIVFFGAIYIVLLLKKEIQRRYLFIFVVVGIFLGMILIKSSSVISVLSNFQDVEELDYYVSYFSRHERDGDILKLISKYIYIPVILLSIYFVPKMNLNNLEKGFFNLGIISFVIRISIVAVPYVGRISAFFEILSCVPVVYMLIYFLQTRNKKLYILVLLYMLLPFAFKVTLFSVGEYDYHSYFLQ